jgi:acyl carrier protein
MADRSDIKDFILGRLAEKLNRLGVSPAGIGDGFDLVRSGLVSSVEYVELIAGLEAETGVVIDFEEFIDADDFTTVGGLIRIFAKAHE